MTEPKQTLISHLGPWQGMERGNLYQNGLNSPFPNTQPQGLGAKAWSDMGLDFPPCGPLLRAWSSLGLKNWGTRATQDDSNCTLSPMLLSLHMTHSSAFLSVACSSRCVVCTAQNIKPHFTSSHWKVRLPSIVPFSSNSKSFSQYFESWSSKGGRETMGDCMTSRILQLGKLSIPDPGSVLTIHSAQSPGSRELQYKLGPLAVYLHSPPASILLFPQKTEKISTPSC